MTYSDLDLDRLLHQANPVLEDELPLPSDSVSAQRLYERITGSPYAGRSRARSRPRPRRHWLGAAVAAMVAVGGAGLAVSNALSSHLQSHLDVTCYAEASVQSQSLAAPVESDGPVAACARAWAAGSVGSGPVPLFVACLAPQGVAAVFPSAPGANVCAQVGLPPLPASGAGASPPVSTTLSPGSMSPTIRDAIVNVLQTSCFDAADAELVVRNILVKARVDWSVVVPSAFPTERPCASPGFDEDQTAVVLTGVPPTTSSTS